MLSKVNSIVYAIVYACIQSSTFSGKCRILDKSGNLKSWRKQKVGQSEGKSWDLSYRGKFVLYKQLLVRLFVPLWGRIAVASVVHGRAVLLVS